MNKLNKFNIVAYLMILIILNILTSCHIDNVATDDTLYTKLIVKAYQRCYNDTIPLKDVKVIVNNADKNTKIDSCITSINGECETKFPIPVSGLPIFVETSLRTRLNDTLKLKTPTFIICSDMYEIVIYDTCLVDECIQVKKVTEPVDSFRVCPIDTNRKIFVQMKRPDGRDVMVNNCTGSNNIIDTVYTAFDVYNPNPFYTILNLSFTKNDMNYYKILDYTNNTQISSVILEPNSVYKFRVQFAPNNQAVNGQCYDAKILLKSGFCECSIDLRACVVEVPEISVNYCLFAYGQKTTRVPDGDWDVFRISSGQTISLMKTYMPNQPPQTPSSMDGDLYVTTKNNAMPPQPGSNLPSLVFTNSRLYQPLGNFLPSQFADAINMNQLLINYMKGNPIEIPSKTISDIDASKVGQVYPFFHNGYYGLLYITGYDDGSNNPLTFQSSVCFKLLYPLCLK